LERKCQNALTRRHTGAAAVSGLPAASSVWACSHLVEPLVSPHVNLTGGQYVRGSYDRARRILELRDNCGRLLSSVLIMA